MRAAARRIMAGAGWLPAVLTRGLKGPGVRILTYHRVVSQPRDRLCVLPREFERQMEHLVESGREVLPLSRLREDRPSGKTGSQTVITFDDGYADVYHHAFPVLKRLGLPASVFVVPGFVEGGSFLQRFGPGEEFLNWEMLREMEAAGMEIGSHTMTHPELTGLSEDGIRRELEESLGSLERNLGVRPRWLAYPRGRFNPAVKTAARRAGYRGAVTVLPGPNRPPFDLFALRRTEISRADGIIDFKFKLLGAFDLWHAGWQVLTAKKSQEDQLPGG